MLLSSAMASSPSERRGIPAAPFVHDVETYLSQSALDANSALSTLQERLVLFPIHIHIHIYVYVYVYVCVRIYLCTCIHVCVHICM